MKHIFFAHSHTLVLCSLGTIEYLRLDHKDCIFLCTRNYIMPERLTDCTLIDANDAYNEFEKYQYGSFLQNRKALAKYDRYVQEWIGGDEFMYYPPHMWGLIFGLLASHKNCKKVSFVQEGAYSISGYFKNNISFLEKLRRNLSSIWNFGNLRAYPCDGWYVDGCLPHQSQIDVYSTSSDFFRYLPENKIRVNIIKWPVYNYNLHINHPEYPIFVFDGYVANRLIDKNTYWKCCERLIKENCKEHNYVKFHPAQDNAEKKFIFSVFKNCNVKYEVFDSVIPFEFYILGGNKLIVVGFGSSLLYYAKDAGHHVIAKSSWLLESPMFVSQVEMGYPVFEN